MISYIKTSNNFSIVFDDGTSVTIQPDYMYYDKVLDAIKTKKYDLVKTLSMPLLAMEGALMKYSNNIGVIGDKLYYLGTQVDNVLTSRIINMIKEGFDVNPMIMFMDNLMMNPSTDAQEELYDFMESTGLPITEDGYLLGYKNVRNDFRDIRTGKIDNSPGCIVEMDRSEVDDNREQTCSAGLHFCGKNYLTSYNSGSNGHTVLVKIHPRDVVSIPTDYVYQKGRACKYEILMEIDANKNDITGTHIWNAENDDFADDFDDDYESMKKSVLLNDQNFEEQSFRHIIDNRDVFDVFDTPPTKKIVKESILSTGVLPDYMKSKD